MKVVFLLHSFMGLTVPNIFFKNIIKLYSNLKLGLTTVSEKKIR